MKASSSTGVKTIITSTSQQQPSKNNDVKMVDDESININIENVRKQVGFMPSSSSSSSMIFHHRKTEHLDWKLIASIDINKLLHSTTSSQELQNTLINQLLPSITYCSIESELNNDEDGSSNPKINSGFIKVFQLAQLLIEYLLYTQGCMAESKANLQNQCTALLGENKKYSVQIQSLKDTLIDAKKELKKRKEMLTNTQNEILGVGNKDEYDQCPYCTKKFITSIYLLSHMQRRHQGLPLHPMFTTTSNTIIQGLNSYQLQQQQQQQQQKNVQVQPQSLNNAVGTSAEEISRQNKVELVTMSTQTSTTNFTDDNADKDNDDEGLSYRILEAKRKASDAANANDTNKNVDIVEESGPNNNNNNMMMIEKMRQDMESQWNNLSAKIQQIGIEELKSAFMDEINKMKEVMTTIKTKTNSNDSGITKTKAKSTGDLDDLISKQPDINNENEANLVAKNEYSEIIQKNNALEEKFTKQEKELELLRNAMQVKMQEDVNIFDGKLQAQERFWRMKLRQVEETYQNQIEKLHTEIQSTVQSQFVLRSGNSSPFKSSAEQLYEIPNVQMMNREKSTTPTELKKDTQIIEINTTPQRSTPIKSMTSSPNKPKDILSSTVDDKNVKTSKSPQSTPKKSPVPASAAATKVSNSKKPIPKPRNTSTPIKETHQQQEQEENTSTILNHEYEEPLSRKDDDDEQNDHVSDYLTTEDEESDSDSESSHNNEEDKEKDESYKKNHFSSENDDIPLRKHKRSVVKKRTHLQDKLYQMEKIREKVLIDVDRKMKELGITNSDGSQLQAENMTKALVELKRRRQSLEKENKEFPEQRQQINTNVNYAVTSKLIDDNTYSLHSPSNLHRRNKLSASTTAKNSSNNSRSPLVKMLSAVKSKGSSWKNKVVTSLTRKKKAPAGGNQIRRTSMLGNNDDSMMMRMGSGNQNLIDSAVEANLKKAKQLMLLKELEEDEDKILELNSNNNVKSSTKNKNASFFSRFSRKHKRRNQKRPNSASKSAATSVEHLSKPKLIMTISSNTNNDGGAQNKKSHYSKSMKIKKQSGKKQQHKVDLSEDSNNDDELSEGEQQGKTNKSSSSSSGEDEERNSEIIRKLAKSLKYRKNNPETTTQGIYKKHGSTKAADKVKRDLLKDFEAVSPDDDDSNANANKVQVQKWNQQSQDVIDVKTKDPFKVQTADDEEEEETYSEEESSSNSKTEANTSLDDDLSFHKYESQTDLKGQYVTLRQPPAGPVSKDTSPSPTQVSKPNPFLVKSQTATTTALEKGRESNESESSTSRMSHSMKIQSSQVQQQGLSNDSYDDGSSSYNLNPATNEDDVSPTTKKNFNTLIDQMKQNKFLPTKNVNKNKTQSPSAGQTKSITPTPLPPVKLDSKLTDNESISSWDDTLSDKKQQQKIPSNVMTRPTTARGGRPSQPQPQQQSSKFTPASNRSPIMNNSNMSRPSFVNNNSKLSPSSNTTNTNRVTFSNAVQKQDIMNRKSSFSSSGSSPVAGRQSPIQARSKPPIGSSTDTKRRWNPPSGKPRLYSSPLHEPSTSYNAFNSNIKDRFSAGGPIYTNANANNNNNGNKQSKNSWDSETN